MESVWKPTNVDIPPVCPRCGSSNTKFCYYNNYSLTQPRYFCKGCRRYWTKGGSLRNVPIGGGCRKSRRSGKSIRVSSSRALLHGGIESTSGNNDNPSSSNTNASNKAPIDLAAVYANFLNPNPREDMVRSNSCQLPENGFLQAIPSSEYPNFVSLGNNIDDHLVSTSCTQNILQMDQGFSTGFLDCGPSYRDVLLTENRLLGGDGSEMYCDGIDIFHQKLDDNGVIVPESNFGSNNTNHHHMENSNMLSSIILPPLPGEDLVPWPAAGSDVHVMMSSNQQVLDTTTHHHHVMTGQVEGQDLGLLNGNNVMLSPSSNLEAIFRR